MQIIRSTTTMVDLEKEHFRFGRKPYQNAKRSSANMFRKSPANSGNMFPGQLLAYPVVFFLPPFGELIPVNWFQWIDCGELIAVNSLRWIHCSELIAVNSLQWIHCIEFIAVSSWQWIHCSEFMTMNSLQWIIVNDDYKMSPPVSDRLVPKKIIRVTRNYFWIVSGKLIIFVAFFAWFVADSRLTNVCLGAFCISFSALLQASIWDRFLFQIPPIPGLGGCWVGVTLGYFVCWFG